MTVADALCVGGDAATDGDTDALASADGDTDALGERDTHAHTPNVQTTTP